MKDTWGAGKTRFGPDTAPYTTLEVYDSDMEDDDPLWELGAAVSENIAPLWDSDAELKYGNYEVICAVLNKHYGSEGYNGHYNHGTIMDICGLYNPTSSPTAAPA